MVEWKKRRISGLYGKGKETKNQEKEQNLWGKERKKMLKSSEKKRIKVREGKEGESRPRWRMRTRAKRRRRYSSIIHCQSCPKDSLKTTKIGCSLDLEEEGDEEVKKRKQRRSGRRGYCLA